MSSLGGLLVSVLFQFKKYLVLWKQLERKNTEIKASIDSDINYCMHTLLMHAEKTTATFTDK